MVDCDGIHIQVWDYVQGYDTKENLRILSVNKCPRALKEKNTSLSLGNY